MKNKLPEFINRMKPPELSYESYTWNEEEFRLEFYDGNKHIVGYYFPLNKEELQEFLAYLNHK